MSLLLRRGIISSKAQFTPAQITTLGWWDASDESTITGSPAVSQIDDKGSVGTFHMVQAVGASQLDTGTRTHNSLNVLDGDGSDFMSVSSFSLPSSGDAVFYGVYGIDSVAAIGDSLYSTSSEFQLQAGNSSNFRAALDVTGIGADIAAFAGNKFGPSIYKAVFDFSGAGQFSVFVDNVENPDGPNTYSTKMSTSIDLNIMTNGSKNREPNGFFAELVVVETADSRIEDYLKAKWNTP